MTGIYQMPEKNLYESMGKVIIKSSDLNLVHRHYKNDLEYFEWLTHVYKKVLLSVIALES